MNSSIFYLNFLIMFFFTLPYTRCVVPKDDLIDGTYAEKNRAHEMYIETKKRVAEENGMKKILTEHYTQETNNELQSIDKEAIETLRLESRRFLLHRVDHEHRSLSKH